MIEAIEDFIGIFLWFLQSIVNFDMDGGSIYKLNLTFSLHFQILKKMSYEWFRDFRNGF